MDSTKLSSEKSKSFPRKSPGQIHSNNAYPVEFATVGKTKDGKIYHHLWGADEINALLRQHGLAKEEETEG
jgi:hypothetical protein